MKFIYDRIIYGKESTQDPLSANENSYGRIEVKESCIGCGACIGECLVGAIRL